MTFSILDRAALDLGRKEVIGPKSDPHILAMLKLDMDWPEDDSTPWCSAAVNWWAWNLGLQRSKSLRARSWIGIGHKVWTQGISERQYIIPWVDTADIIIFSRGRWSPGPETIKAPGHVAIATGNMSEDETKIEVIGGNQGDKVSVRMYPLKRVLAVRRLKHDLSQTYWPQ